MANAKLITPFILNLTCTIDEAGALLELLRYSPDDCKTNSICNALDAVPEVNLKADDFSVTFENSFNDLICSFCVESKP